ncbi:DUF397 domain-containing protein [Actinacidiphila oryziradicis]|uniref:DUF397 domain-containing protein n=1 Tax=Actinacidiphila oryziradicis TaxID=2571141 RepID=A0A4U0SP29_9ACTN|nr:DUF397 domain-containing protein [Actinacidiphila oryziradicis]TKA11566.1 DUF397 domain-containing protein [Actinacidiphila oryziradicis]
MIVDSNWQKSSFSSTGNNCVELARSANGILIREGDNPGVAITTTRTNLAVFLRGVQAGEFDWQNSSFSRARAEQHIEIASHDAAILMREGDTPTPSSPPPRPS